MRCMYPFLRMILLAIIFLVINNLFGQNEEHSNSYHTIISEIGILESNRDPKCHATANRLEDFMFGTPLCFEARSFKTQLQKDIAYSIWSEASQKSKDDQLITEAELTQIIDAHIKLIISKGTKYIQTRERSYIKIDDTDLRQYASVAYSLRAILAVQQQALFSSERLFALQDRLVNKLKMAVDIASLAILKEADRLARIEMQYEVQQVHLQKAYDAILHKSVEGKSKPLKRNSAPPSSNYVMTNKTITQKLESYQNYNDINSSLFLRNIQVYFAKTMWPKGDDAKALVDGFQEALILFSKELLMFSEKLAIQDSVSYISMAHMNRSAVAFLPFEVDAFEDVIYFPLLEKENQIKIESYDLDAFRDSGLHWKMLEFALKDSSFSALLEPDPFALELLVESIAQFGVLLWRMGGKETKASGLNVINHEMLLKGMTKIRTLTKSNNSRYGRDTENISKIVSAQKEESSIVKAIYFKEVTELAGIKFEHRSADWLSRKLRSYVFKPDENLARLAIPPAFGGSGVAAADINNDGFDDILLLGGHGNTLFLNNGDKSFSDITSLSGINVKRSDGTYSEPRQPIIVDFNNDGYQDIFISLVNDDHRLLKGNGTGEFIDVSVASNLGGSGLVGGPCTALDFDNDGLLDLYIGNFGNYLVGELPTLSRNNTGATPNMLFKNMGNFEFKNVTKGSGVDNRGWTQAVGHTDINSDGWQDIIVGNDFGSNSYYLNQGDGTFIDQASTYGTDKASYTMNIGIGDLNRDQSPDFYISNIVVMKKDDKYVLPDKETTMHFDPASLSTMRVIEANDFFLSNNTSNRTTYQNAQIIDRGFSNTGWSWDADFFDYDNDGDDDLYCLNGMNPYSVYGTDNEYYRSPEGENADVQFANSQAERNVFFVNNKGKLFQENEQSGLDLLHTSRSAAYLDYDNDGDLDVIVNNYHGKAYLFENQTELLNNHWIKVQIINNDEAINKDGIGTRIICSTTENKGMWRELHSTDGYLSVHPKSIHFGLGKAQSAELDIIWPDGIKATVKIDDVNQSITIERKDRKTIMKNTKI